MKIDSQVLKNFFFMYITFEKVYIHKKSIKNSALKMIYELGKFFK